MDKRDRKEDEDYDPNIHHWDRREWMIACDKFAFGLVKMARKRESYKITLNHRRSKSDSRQLVYTAKIVFYDEKDKPRELSKQETREYLNPISALKALMDDLHPYEKDLEIILREKEKDWPE